MQGSAALLQPFITRSSSADHAAARHAADSHFPDLSLRTGWFFISRGEDMKRIACGLMAVMLTVSGISNGGEPGRRAVNEKAVMAYFSMPMGPSARGRQEPMSFGLRLQQGTPLGWQRPVPLVDFRLRADGRKTLRGAGVMMLDSFDSVGGSFSGRPWLVALAVGGGAAALACILDVICGDDGDDDYDYEPTGG
jgi:hypothetical protein